MRHRIIDAARSHLGTPWVHQGRLPPIALDCAGLVIIVARSLGLVPADFDINGYKRIPDGSMSDILSKYLIPVDKSQMEPGDVIEIAFDKDPQHVGILVPYRHGGIAMVHAASRSGKVEETRLMFTHAMRFAGAYSFPGVQPWHK